MSSARDSHEPLELCVDPEDIYYDVELVDFGPSRTRVLVLIRQHQPELSPADLLRLVANLPAIVLPGVKHDDIKLVIRQLWNLNAHIALRGPFAENPLTLEQLTSRF